MSAGQLNRRVTIERRAISADAYGNTQGAWAALYSSLPAEIRPVKTNAASAETVDAGSVVAVGLVEVKLRYSSRTRQILPSDRVIDARAGKVYDIRAIEQPDMRNKYLRLLCQAGVANG